MRHQTAIVVALQQLALQRARVGEIGAVRITPPLSGNVQAAGAIEAARRRCGKVGVTEFARARERARVARNMAAAVVAEIEAVAGEHEHVFAIDIAHERLEFGARDRPQPPRAFGRECVREVRVAELTRWERRHPAREFGAQADDRTLRIGEFVVEP